MITVLPGSRILRYILLWALAAFILLKIDKWITVGIGDSPLVPVALLIELPLLVLLWRRPGRLIAGFLVAFFSVATLTSLIFPAFDCG